MEFWKRRFIKQDRNGEKNKKIKEFLKKIELDKDEHEDSSSDSSPYIQKVFKFRKINTGRARAKSRKKKSFKTKNLFKRKHMHNPGQDMPQDQYMQNH